MTVLCLGSRLLEKNRKVMQDSCLCDVACRHTIGRKRESEFFKSDHLGNNLVFLQQCIKMFASGSDVC